MRVSIVRPQRHIKTENSLATPLVVPPNGSIHPSNSPVENEGAMDIADEERNESGSKSAYSWCQNILRAYKNAGGRMRMRMRMRKTLCRSVRKPGHNGYC
jgi:hypothetical protein